MTRAFSPPDTLSKDDIRTIADVRRDIWTNAFTGMAGGAFAGLGLHSVAQVCSKRGILPALRLSRNTAFFAVLGGAALGSFLLATTAGKNQVHKLHPIFEVGKRDVSAQGFADDQPKS